MISAAFVETRVHASCILLAAGSATKYPGAAVILNKKQSKFNWNVSRYFRSWCRSYYAILTTLCIIRARVPTSLSLSPFPLIPENVYLPFYTGERCLQRFPALPADGDVFPMHFYQTTLSLPVMRRHIRTSRFVFFVFAGAFLRYYSGEPLFAHENYSGILRRVSCTSLHLINIPEYANDVSCSGWAPVSPKCGSEISPWSRQFCYENIDSTYYLLCCNWYYFLLVFFCNLLSHIFIALVHGQRM